MRSINQVIQDKEPNIIRKFLVYDWIFSSPLEKILLALICAFSVYNLVRLFL